MFLSLYIQAAVVWNFCLIGNIRHNFLIPRMIKSVPMPIQTPDLHRVYYIFHIGESRWLSGVRGVSKACRITAKPGNILNLWCQLSFLAFNESYGLRIKRKHNKIWTRNEILILRFRVNNIRSNRGGIVKFFIKTSQSAKKCIICTLI